MISRRCPRVKARGLRLRGGGHVIRDDRVGRVRACVRGVPDRHHDERHNRDYERRPDHKFDHFRAAGVVVKLAQQMQGVSPPLSVWFQIANYQSRIWSLSIRNSLLAIGYS